jgi:uncharacterized protein (TIGR00251 family)
LLARGTLHDGQSGDASRSRHWVYAFDMPTAPLTLTPKSGGLALAVKVVPGASRNRVAGEYAGGIRITVDQAPVDGAANQAVIALLAKTLNIPTAQVRISRGQRSPRKEVIIAGLSADLIQERLLGAQHQNPRTS